jgi:hypothetical protein
LLTEKDEMRRVLSLKGRTVAEVYLYPSSDGKSRGISTIRFTDGALLFLNVVRTDEGEFLTHATVDPGMGSAAGDD